MYVFSDLGKCPLWLPVSSVLTVEVVLASLNQASDRGQHLLARTQDVTSDAEVSESPKNILEKKFVEHSFV
jgi:hypothetical protein